MSHHLLPNVWWVITVIIKLLILLCVISFSISLSFSLVRMLFLFHQFSARKSSLWLNIFVYKSHYRTIWSFFSFEFSACFKFRRGFPNFRLVFRLLCICDWFTMYLRPFSVRVRIFGYMFDFSATCSRVSLVTSNRQIEAAATSRLFIYRLPRPVVSTWRIERRRLRLQQTILRLP